MHGFVTPVLIKDEIAKGIARERSRQRFKYVLGQMYKNELLTPDIYESEVGKGTTFYIDLEEAEAKCEQQTFEFDR